MKEQDLFHYLFWVSPTISGIITVLQALENAIFFPETPLLVPYSACAKTPFPMDRMDELVILKVLVVLLIKRKNCNAQQNNCFFRSTLHVLS